MKRVSIVIVLLFWLVQFSSGAIYYVDISGNDASGDGSSAKPWRTLKFAVSKVAGNQGHTIRISSGTFIEQGPIDVPTGVNIEGSGHSTVLKAASSFYYYPAEPGLSPTKYLIRFISTSRTNGGQSIKNLTINGDGKKLHGGILFQNRDNILVEGIRMEYINFNGLWLWRSKNSRITNCEFLNCTWAHYNACYGVLMIGDLENVEIDHVKIDEGWGYGLKALNFGTGTPTALTNVKIHDCTFTVNSYGVWHDNQHPNIAVELWNTYLSNVEFYNNYIDNILSIVSEFQNQVGRRIWVHHNFFDMAARSKGEGYSIELTVDNVEIDHNFFNTGVQGISNWGRNDPRKDWNIHHNTFYRLGGYWPAQAVRSNSAINNLKFNNNTFESAGDKTANVVGLYGGASGTIEIKNNLLIDLNTAYNHFKNQFVYVEKGKASIQNLQVSNNLFHKLDVGNVPGTYTNNITGMDPQINASGKRADPYYVPKAGSPLIDKGVNVGYPYSGSAPDIGAFEYGSSTTPPVNTPPSIGLSSPTNNASFAAGSSITLSANAADANGTIAKVEFFNGTTKLGEDATGPYSFVWNNVAAGTYTITAKATDNQGATTTSTPVTITVVANTNTFPTVNITSPANNASFNAGSSVTINANATDANGTVSKVEFFNGTTKLGEDTSSPYSFTWSNVAAGTYSITARATDNQNAITNSTAITIVVSAANALPTVSLTGPANNSTFTAPASLTLTATAADADGTVTKVEFFNGTTKLGEDTSSPYSFNWNNVAAGTYSLTARATDNRNAITNSAVVTLNVRANTLPSVSIASPANNSTFTTNSSITITANATDADGTLTKVEFYYGNTKLGEDATSPYSITWGNVPAGTYLLKAVAFDNNGGSSTSANITVTVGNLSNSLPSVSLTSPGNNATFPQGSVITLMASASDSDGSIAKVEFYNGTTKLGEDTASPYAFVWNNVPAGSYSLTAKATDDKNGVSTSAAVNINVTSPNNLPVANAGKDATVALPDNTYLLQGSGEDSDGIIMNYEWTQVEGPNDATLTVSAGGEAMITNLVEGTYKFVLTVTDNGNLTSSDEIIIKVIPVSPASVQLPLVFTPNNDGIDDTWNWSNTEAFENCRLTIYNRLGQKIYETISYDNTWDGRVNGSPLQEDAYYYVITCDNSDRQGAVRIVR